MNGVVGEFVNCHVGTHLTGARRIGNDAAHEATKLILDVLDVTILVDECGQVGATAVSCALVQDGRQGSQHGCQCPSRVAGVITQPLELREVVGRMALVPGHKDGFYVGEVLVERGSADAGPLGDLGHGDSAKSVFGDELGSGVQDCVDDLAPVRLDRLCPQLRHPGTVATRGLYTLRIDQDRTYRIMSARMKPDEIGSGTMSWVWKAVLITVGALILGMIIVAHLLGGFRGPNG